MELEEIKNLTKTLGEQVKNKKYPDKERVSGLEQKLRKNLRELADEIITDENSETLVSTSEALGLLLKVKGVSSSQLRNIFGYVKRLEADVKGNTEDKLPQKTILKLRLLSPKMAYVIGRAQNYSVRTLEILKSFFDECIEKIGDSKEKFEKFINVFEAILSYHKYYGGK